MRTAIRVAAIFAKVVFGLCALVCFAVPVCFLWLYFPWALAVIPAVLGMVFVIVYDDSLNN